MRHSLPSDERPILVCAPTAAELPQFDGDKGVITAVLGRIGHSAVKPWVRLLEEHKPAATVLVGVAGGIAPDLVLGDAILAPLCRHEDNQADFSAALVDAARDAAKDAGIALHEGPVATVDHIYSPSEKHTLYKQHSDILACDMEGYWLAQEALERKHDLVMMRVVLDTVDEDLSGFSKLADSQGRLHNWKVLLAPSTWTKLPGMTGRLKQTRATLERWVEAIVKPRGDS